MRVDGEKSGTQAELAKIVEAPTLPFTDNEMEKILDGVERYPNHRSAGGNNTGHLFS